MGLLHTLRIPLAVVHQIVQVVFLCSMVKFLASETKSLSATLFQQRLFDCK
ncbi:Adenine-specific DNA methylase [Pseudomonas syringae pv. actinidiae]|uniref:Adenine-specific DNA methylase n=1 Tax=Pseudomonas syringae pv. actinidiae TaxID=103796 RepID=A0A2V0QKX3_PSESF|nr:Adenine-specific DNA methylase [Pseudomonas syringae pv. actinidiae]